ncbi:MAG: hypothetical protein ACOX7P_08620 [Oscillospiraceae bacterium]|jgi:hypothetical protein
MKRRLIIRLAASVICALFFMVFVAAASGYGTAEDPLVTLSYLTSVFSPSVMSQVDTRIEQAKKELTSELKEITDSLGSSASAEFSVVSVDSGKTLIGGVGTEIMLRVGSAVCVAASSPGLIDETDGSELSGGASLKTNHLYMVTVEGRGLKATSASKVLIRGPYTIS